MNKSFIKGYPVGANISLLNVIYHKSKKDPNTNKYGIHLLNANFLFIFLGNIDNK